MEKKKFSLFAWMQKIPGGIILVPLFIGIFMNTFFPQALQIGGFTTGMFKTGTGCLLGLFLMLNGAAIDVRHIGQPFYRGFVLTAMKFVVGVALGLLVSLLCGKAGLLGITPMAIIAAITNSAGGEYLALAKEYGTPDDAGAISLLSLNDGPFFTMVAMGAAIGTTAANATSVPSALAEADAATVHIKINEKEARDIGMIVANRLNSSDHKVKLLVPTDGMRHNTTKGEALYDAAADKALIDTIKANVGPHVEVIEIEGNLDTPAWGEKAADIMLQVMAEAGISGKKD